MRNSIDYSGKEKIPTSYGSPDINSKPTMNNTDCF